MIGTTIDTIGTVGDYAGFNPVDKIGDLFGGSDPGEGKDAIEWSDGGSSTVEARWQQIAQDTSKSVVERTTEAFRVLSRNVDPDEDIIQKAEWNGLATRLGFPRISSEVTIEDGVREWEVRSAIVSGSGSLPTASAPAPTPTTTTTTTNDSTTTEADAETDTAGPGAASSMIASVIEQLKGPFGFVVAGVAVFTVYQLSQ